MPTSASPEAAGDDAQLAAYGADLAGAIETALPSWVAGLIVETARAWQPGLEAELGSESVAAGNAALSEVGPLVRELLRTDPDRQRGTPLALVRAAVRIPTRILADAGVGEVVRDGFAVETFPDDVYGLTPASLADLSPAAHEAGLVWGAAKAHVILARRRREGMR